MVRKKKKREEEAVIFCYYCDRIFSDETTLIQHQKARHYKCSTCHKKLNTIQGLAIHCSQVHKVNVELVPNAMAGRESVNVEIFGMAGVPEGAAPGITIPLEEESDSKRAATGQGVAASSILAPPGAPGYQRQPAPGPAYPPQYGAPVPYGYPAAGMMPPGMPLAYLRPGMPAHMYPQRPGQPPMGMPPMRPPPGMPMPNQAMPFQAPPHAGQPPFSAPGQIPSSAPGMPVPVQPLFPISGTPAAEGAAQPHSGAHQQVPGVASAGGSLFPINLQDPAKPVASAGQPESGAALGAQPVDPKAPGELPTVTAGEADLVWQEENVSMEERRAQLTKYAPRRPQAQASAVSASGSDTAAYQAGPPAQVTQVPGGLYHQ